MKLAHTKTINLWWLETRSIRAKWGKAQPQDLQLWCLKPIQRSTVALTAL